MFDSYDLKKQRRVTPRALLALLRTLVTAHAAACAEDESGHPRLSSMLDVVACAERKFGKAKTNSEKLDFVEFTYWICSLELPAPIKCQVGAAGKWQVVEKQPASVGVLGFREKVFELDLDAEMGQVWG